MKIDEVIAVTHTMLGGLTVYYVRLHISCSVCQKFLSWVTVYAAIALKKHFLITHSVIILKVVHCFNMILLMAE